MFIPKEASVEDIHKQIEGNGHFLPLKVIFKVWPEEDGWIEPGMKAYIVDMVDFGDGFAIQTYLYFGEHEDWNHKFFKADFKKFDKEGIMINKDVDAIESGHYSARTHVFLPKDDSIHKYFEFI